MFACCGRGKGFYKGKSNVESGAFRKRRIIRYFFLSPCLELSRWCIDYIGFYIERKILRLNSNRSDPGCFSRIGFGPGFFLTAGSGSTHPWIRHNLDILPCDGQDTGMFGITMPDQNMHSLYIKIGTYFIFLKDFFKIFFTGVQNSPLSLFCAISKGNCFLRYLWLVFLETERLASIQRRCRLTRKGFCVTSFVVSVNDTLSKKEEQITYTLVKLGSVLWTKIWLILSGNYIGKLRHKISRHTISNYISLLILTINAY